MQHNSILKGIIFSVFCKEKILSYVKENLIFSLHLNQKL
jgi:hypothetical protein